MYQLSTMLLPCTELSLSLLATLCIEVLQLQFQVTEHFEIEKFRLTGVAPNTILNYSSYVLLFVELHSCFVGVNIPILLATVFLGMKSHRRVPHGFLRIITDLGSMETLRNCAIIKMTPAAIASNYEGNWNTIIK